MIAFTEATIASSGGQRQENESRIATDDLTMLSCYNVTTTTVITTTGTGTRTGE